MKANCKTVEVFVEYFFFFLKEPPPPEFSPFPPPPPLPFWKKKHRRGGGTGPDPVEWNRKAFRALSRKGNFPAATIRVISDAADEDLPLDFNTLMSPAQK